MFGANQPVHTLWVERHIGRIKRFRGGCVATLSLWYPPDPEQPRFDQVCRAIHLPRAVTGLARSEVGVELESRGGEDFPEAVKAIIQVPDSAPDCRSAELPVALGFRAMLRKLGGAEDTPPTYLATGRVDDEGRVLHVADVLHKAVLAGRHGLSRSEPRTPEIVLLLPRDNARDVEWDQADWEAVQADYAAAYGLESISLEAGRLPGAAPGQRLYLDVSSRVASGERRTCRVRFVMVQTVAEAEVYLWGEQASERSDALVTERLRNARLHRHRAELQGLAPPAEPSRWDRLSRVGIPTLAALAIAGLLLPRDDRREASEAVTVHCDETSAWSDASDCPSLDCPQTDETNETDETGALAACPPTSPTASPAATPTAAASAPTLAGTVSPEPAEVPGVAAPTPSGGAGVIAAFDLRFPNEDAELLDYAGALSDAAARLGGRWTWGGQRARVHPEHPDRVQLPALALALNGHPCDVGGLASDGASRTTAAAAITAAMTACFDQHGAGYQPDVNAFSAWLAQRPDWQADDARARGRGDRGYLKGWRGHTPRPEDTGPVTRVSALAGAVYCANHGGLAPLDGPVSTGLRGEWRRTEAGSYVVRMADGALDARPPTWTSPNVGIRCRWGEPS